jgi:hypothetical protein
MEQWLIRTEKNWIKGPYSKEQVCKMITDGTLGVQDEVCPANGYWILLHERKEIFEHLGVEVPRAAGVEDEVTESDIDTTLEESTVNGENSDSIAAASHSVSDTLSARRVGSRRSKRKRSEPEMAEFYFIWNWASFNYCAEGV